MPNPKAGTVSMDVTKAIEDIKAGKIEYRLDKNNIIHVPVGKASFTERTVSGQLPDVNRCYYQSKTVSSKRSVL